MHRTWLQLKPQRQAACAAQPPKLGIQQRYVVAFDVVAAHVAAVQEVV
jgi:hypothetical protein